MCVCVCVCVRGHIRWLLIWLGLLEFYCAVLWVSFQRYQLFLCLQSSFLVLSLFAVFVSPTFFFAENITKH